MLYKGLSLALTLILSGCSSTPSDEGQKALEKKYYSQKDTVIDFDYQIFFDNGEELFFGDLSRMASYRACMELSRDPANEKFNMSCGRHGQLTYSMGPLIEHNIDYSFSESNNTLKVFQRPYPLPKHVPYLMEKLPEIKQLQQRHAEKIKKYTIENRQHWDDYLQTIDSRKKKIVEFYADNGISVDYETLTTDNEPMLSNWERRQLNDIFEKTYRKQVLAGGPYSVDEITEQTTSHFMEQLEHDNRIETLRPSSWNASNNTNNGYYFIINEAKLPQLLVLRTHVDDCRSYNMGLSFSATVNNSFERTLSCQVEVDGKTVANGPCDVTAKADIDYVSIMMNSNDINDIRVEDLKVAPNAKITYRVIESDPFSFTADDLKLKAMNLTQSCLKRENI